MRINKILPLVALVGSALTFSACDDDKMDWHTPEGHLPIDDISEIPLSDNETLANYKTIKEYMNEYLPNVPIGLGLTADKFIKGENFDAEYQKVAADNFTQYVTGNAMKYGVVCNASGEFDFSKIDEYIAQAKATNPGVKFFGHNLIWHTQQPQTYLLSLIAEQVDVIDGGNFEEGKLGKNWSKNGGNADTIYVTDKIECAEGNGTHCAVLKSKADHENDYSAQLEYAVSNMIVGTEYYMSFWYKGDENVAGAINSNIQETTNWGGVYNETLDVTTSWKRYEKIFTCNTENLSVFHINFGKKQGTYYVDNIILRKHTDEVIQPVTNPDPEPSTDPELEPIYMDFEDGSIAGWSKYDAKVTCEVSAEGEGYNGTGYALKLTNSEDREHNHSAQVYYQLPTASYKKGDTYVVSFNYKADFVDDKDEKFQAQLQNRSGTYPGAKYFGAAVTEADKWLSVETEFEIDEKFVSVVASNPEKMHITFDIGAKAGTIWIDNIKFEKKSAGSKRAVSDSKSLSKRHVQYESDVQKTALIDAMEKWITTIVSKYKDDIQEWDVLNEPIGDDSKIRGVDGGYMSGDGIPTDTEEDGFNLNWVSGVGNQHFYWGYFLGKDYAVKAFQFARNANASAKLYVNEYNLETSDSKLEALIDYVKYIDANGGQVDGIGTQMHIMSFNVDSTKNDDAKAGIINMFTKLAATGKLVRVSELDVAFSATHDADTKVTPSADQLKAQAETYRFVMEQYKKLVPDAQKGGFTIWTLTDSDAEHEYWLQGDKPNLFNADYSRKPAYKGLCDGIAGKDLSTEFDGSMWNN